MNSTDTELAQLIATDPTIAAVARRAIEREKGKKQVRKEFLMTLTQAECLIRKAKAANVTATQYIIDGLGLGE